MLVALLLIFSAIHGLLFLESFRWADNSHWRVWFLRLLLFTMAYDNLMQGLGSVLIEKAWFLVANYPRYYFHVFVYPILIVFALSITSDTAAAVARQLWFRSLCVAMVVIVCVYGAYYELFGLELVVRDAVGVTYFDKADNRVFYATSITNLFVLFLAAVIWKISGWKWFFLGCLLFLVMAKLSSGLAWGFIAKNLTDILFAIATLQTEKYFAHKRI